MVRLALPFGIIDAIDAVVVLVLALFLVSVSSLQVSDIRRHPSDGFATAGYFPEPSFRVMHTGEGSISVDGIDLGDGHLQFAQFGPRVSFAGNAILAVPPEANTLLVPFHRGDDDDKKGGSDNQKGATIAIVMRGLCSFEAKMRAALAAGADGVILVNQEADEPFLAVADADARPPVSKDEINGKLPAQPCENSLPPPEIPFVVVSSSAGEALLQNNRSVHVSVQPLNEGVSTCWGSWNTQPPSTKGMVVLPLFPVSTEPLLPGTELKMHLGKKERDELQEAAKRMPKSQPVRVAVAFCKDPETNLMAEMACVASVDLEAVPGQKNSVTLKGIEPCFIRTLVRDSTKTSFGLALATIPTAVAVAAVDRPNGEDDDNAATAAALRESIRIAGLTACDRASAEHFCDMKHIDAIEEEINGLPQDPGDFSFAACRLLDLPPRQLQAALACSTAERLQGAASILARIEERNNIERQEEDTNDDRADNTERSRSFVAKAVAKALPSVVRVEPSGEKGEKAAGFVVSSDSSDGIIVTNRHVVSAGSIGAPIVTFQDGVAVPAKLLAVSERYDIAFLSVHRSDLSVAQLGDGDAVQLGDWMIAMGSPAEFDNLVSLGIASTLQRPNLGDKAAVSLDRSATFIGTDALFNKGISGGPLLNDAGDVVGMCTYLREDLNGLGFAIAINRVSDAAHELLGRDL